MCVHDYNAYIQWDAWKIWLKINFSKYSIDFFQFIFVPKEAALLSSDE